MRFGKESAAILIGLLLLPLVYASVVSDIQVTQGVRSGTDYPTLTFTWKTGVSSISYLETDKAGTAVGLEPSTTHSITIGTGSGVILPDTTYKYRIGVGDRDGDVVLTPSEGWFEVQTSSGTPSCIPDGGLDDVLSNTVCCSNRAVEGSTLCELQSDWYGSWRSCTQICGITGVTAPKCPHGPTGTEWCPCPAGTSSNGRYGIGVCMTTSEPVRVTPIVTPPPEPVRVTPIQSTSGENSGLRIVIGEQASLDINTFASTLAQSLNVRYPSLLDGNGYMMLDSDVSADDILVGDRPYILLGTRYNNRAIAEVQRRRQLTSDPETWQFLAPHVLQIPVPSADIPWNAMQQLAETGKSLAISVLQPEIVYEPGQQVTVRIETNMYAWCRWSEQLNSGRSVSTTRLNEEGPLFTYTYTYTPTPGISSSYIFCQDRDGNEEIAVQRVREVEVSAAGYVSKPQSVTAPSDSETTVPEEWLPPQDEQNQEDTVEQVAVVTAEIQAPPEPPRTLFARIRFWFSRIN